MEEIEITIIEEDSLPYEDPILRKGQFKTWGTPAESSTRIICTQEVFGAIEEHARNDDLEVGGILLGKAFRNEGFVYVEITEYIAAPGKPQQEDGPALSSRVHFSFTPEVWAEMLRLKDQKYDELKVVGWFHSHPGHGIFLSRGMDTRIHEEFFQQSWQVAMVYDPVRHEGGFFIWDDSRIVPAPGFYELFDPESQDSVVTWKNLYQLTNAQNWPRLQKGAPILIAMAFVAFLLLYISIENEIEEYNNMLQSAISENEQQLVALKSTLEANTNNLATAMARNAEKINVVEIVLTDTIQTQAAQEAIVSTIQVQNNQRLDILVSDLGTQDENLATISAANELLVTNMEVLNASLAEINQVQVTQEAFLATVQSQLAIATATPTHTIVSTITPTAVQETITSISIVATLPTPTTPVESLVSSSAVVGQLGNRLSGWLLPVLILAGFASFALVVLVVLIKKEGFRLMG